MKTDREKIISAFVDNIMTQKEWENNKNLEIEKISKKFMNELDKYIYVEIDDLPTLKLGGYIRYVTANHNIGWGGILIKVSKTKNGTYLYLKNMDKQVNKIRYENYFVFYKSHQTYSDKVRDIFISYLDKIPDDD